MFVLFDCAVPSGAPENVTAEAMSSTRMLVTWGPVPEPQQNGNILGYKVVIENVKLLIRDQVFYLEGILEGQGEKNPEYIWKSAGLLHKCFSLGKSLTFTHDHALLGP